MTSQQALSTLSYFQVPLVQNTVCQNHILLSNIVLKHLGLAEKKGECPLVKPAIPIDGICPEECGYDIDCPDDLKCCSNGCGHVCMKPGKIIKNIRMVNKGVTNQLLQLCTVRTAWSDSDQAMRAVHSCNSW